MKKRIAAALLAVLILSLTACGQSAAQKYTDYVQGVMDCSYRGEFDAYTKSRGNKDNTEAQEVYDATVENYAYQLMNYLEVEYNYIDEDIIEQYKDLAAKLLMKTKYTVNKAEIAGKEYHIKLEIQPLDFCDIVVDAATAVADQYNADQAALGENATDEQLIELENAYARNMLEAVTPFVDQVGYKDTKTKVVIMQEGDEGYGLEDADWQQIDNMVVDMD